MEYPPFSLSESASSATFPKILRNRPRFLAAQIARRLSQRLARVSLEVARPFWAPRPGWAPPAAASPALSSKGEELVRAFEQRAWEAPEVWLIYSGSHFDATGGAQRPAQMARELVRSALVGYTHWRQPEEQRGEMFLFPPATLQYLLPRLPLPRRVLLLTLPDESGLALARQARRERWTIVYDCLDFWREFETEWYRVEREEELVSLAHWVVTSARKLEQWVEFLGAKQSLYLPNAASPACWLSTPTPPADLHAGSLTLLYSGWLGGSWLAWSLLRQVARYGETRNWQIHLIGEPTTRRICRPNVHFLGPRSYPDLGAYLQHSDVCLIPFVTNLLTQCVSPLKAFDYVAAGKPIVSTPLPELEGMPFCWQRERPRDFCRAIEAAAATPIDPAVGTRFRAEHTFAQRVAILRERVFPGA